MGLCAGTPVNLEASNSPGTNIPRDDGDEGGIRGSRLAWLIAGCVIAALLLGCCALFAMRHVGREKKDYEASQGISHSAAAGGQRGRNEATRAAAAVPTADVRPFLCI